MKSLRKTARFLAPYKLLILGTILTTILPVVMELVVPRLMQMVIDAGIRESDFQVVWQGALYMFLAAVVGAIATFGQGVFRARLSQALAFDIRNELYQKVMALSHADVDQIQTGQLITRLTSDVDTVRMFCSVGISLLLRALLMVVGSLIMVTVTHPPLSLIAWIILVLTCIVMRWSFVRATPMFAVVQRRLAALNVVVQENLAGMSEVRAFVQEHSQILRFGRANDSLVDQNIRVARLLAIAMPLIALLTNLGLVGMTWFGGTEVILERVSLGQLVAFNSYLIIGLTPLLLLSGMLAMFSRATASSVRIWEVLETEPAVRQRPAAETGPVQGRIEFRNVHFAYSGRSGALSLNGRSPQAAPEALNGVHRGPADTQLGEGVLQGLSFVIEPGQTVGLIGATGSGKSSLMYLIPRFYDVSEGSILIDGVDVRDWDLAALRQAIGLVAQHPALFARTIAANIAFGQPDMPEARVEEMARKAQAHDFVLDKEGGYFHLVEEGGANLSGGQKQRLSIARAMAIKPRILLLDDATSSVDLETEAKIQETFQEAAQGLTTIIVAHRVSSIIHADRILILDEGRLESAGTHEELLASSPIYRELYESQLG